MSTPIALSDQYLVNLINNPEVRRAFPFFQNLAQNIKASGKSCFDCQGQLKKDHINQLQRAREYVIGLSETDLARLKQTIGIPSRTFVTYSGGKKSTRIVR